MWYFHDKNSSTCKPKNFVDFSSVFEQILLSSVPFIDKTKLSKLLFFCGARMTIYFVLLGFRDNLLTQNQLNTSFIAVFDCLYNVGRSWCDKYTDVSSAKDRTFSDVDTEMSLTYIRYKSGPRIDPCGTPHIISSRSDFSPSISTYWNLCDR